ncbi:hypothetical protein [Butyrivibrio proteoclasticus]|uniref:hypothetical protein n=1 Tax=Butyrivibrio proteoclasticus TaxID=43305 RepID=UPI00047E465C|nr:hypothetical protein [Butyrivibrio proteoclasticus]
MGLHYLKNLEFLNVHGAQTESLYDEIIAGTYENADFEKSRYYTDEMEFMKEKMTSGEILNGELFPLPVFVV